MHYATCVIDMDEVMVMFLDDLVKKHNLKYGTTYTVNDFTEYKLPEELINTFLEPGFFYNLKPFPNAIETISRLIHLGYEIVVATHCNEIGYIAQEKIQWLQKNAPFLLSNLVITKRKDLLRGDLIFDDAPHFLDSFKGIKVAMDRPYNQNTVVDYRVKSWTEFENVAKKLLTELKYISYNKI